MSTTWTARLLSSIRWPMRYVPRQALWPRPEQRIADPVRVARKPGIAKLQYSSSNGEQWRTLVGVPCRYAT